MESTAAAGPDALAGYRNPSPVARDKEIDRIDAHCRAFIGLSPWAVLATADADGWPELSPRGGERGFVRVLDDTRLLLPDRQGNNRIDSLHNVAANPRVSLMFVVPRIEEVLRVYGTATLVGPDDLPAGSGLQPGDLTEFGRAPLSLMVVTVRRAYFQCAKSLMRSGLWDPDSWGERADFAPIGQVFRDHCRLETPLPPDDVLRAALADEL